MKRGKMGLALGCLLLAAITLLGGSSPVVVGADDLSLEIAFLFPAVGGG